MLKLGDIQAAFRDAEAAVALAPAEQQQFPLMVRAEVAFAMKDTGLAVSIAERVPAQLAGLRRAPSSCSRSAARRRVKSPRRSRSMIAPSRLFRRRNTAISGKIFALDFLDGADVADQRRRAACGGSGSARPFRVAGSKASIPIRSGACASAMCPATCAITRRASAIRPVLRCHDRAQVEIFAYSSTSKTGSRHRRIPRTGRTTGAMLQQLSERRTRRLHHGRPHRHPCRLLGSYAGNRLPAFARKPAPVQVSAWGHATGTGMPVMDYLFGDKIVIPTRCDRCSRSNSPICPA